MGAETRNMFGFPERLYHEERKNFRVRDRVPIKWAAASGGSGAGRVRDISTSGALIETDTSHPIVDGTVISLKQQVDDQGEFLPTQAKVVWSKPRGFLKRGVVVGVEFTDSPDSQTDLLKERIEKKMKTLRAVNRALGIIAVILFIIMFALIGVLLFQRSVISRTVVTSNAIMLSASEKQAKLYQDLLGQFRALQSVYVKLQIEYVTTKGVLAQTEGLLAEANRQYAQAQNEISNLRNSLAAAKIGTLSDNIAALTAQRDSLRDDLRSLQEEIRLVAAENPQEFQEQTALYESRADAIDLKMQNLKYDTLLAKIKDQQNEIVVSKKRIRDLKVEAALVKRETQQKKNEIALAQGNHGFVTKDGKAVAGKSNTLVTNTAQEPAPKVNVAVSVF